MEVGLYKVLKEFWATDINSTINRKIAKGTCIVVTYAEDSYFYRIKFIDTANLTCYKSSFDYDYYDISNFVSFISGSK